MKTNRYVYFTECPYEKINVYANDDILVVRLLEKNKNKDNDLTSTSNLYSLNKINKKSVLIQDEIYTVFIEVFFDKTNSYFSRLWDTSSDICMFYDFRNGEVFFDDKNSFTYLNKTNPSSFLKNKRIVVPFQMFIWNKTDGFNDVAKSFVVKRSEDLITNLNLEGIVVQDNLEIKKNPKLIQYLKPKYTIKTSSHCKSNETIDILVECKYPNNELIDTNTTYDLEAVSGYLPIKRLTLKHGVGKFRATALGLFDGEEMRIKISKKNYSGLAECIIKIKNTEE